MNKKQTSERVAKVASSVLRDKRYGSKSKTVAASALSHGKTKKQRKNNTIRG